MRILGIDVDEVCADFIGGFNARASRVLERDFNGRPWPYWPIHQSLGVTRDEVERVWNDIEVKGQFWEYLQPRPGVLAAFNVLERWITSHEAEVVFITSRQHNGTAVLRKLTKKWLRGWGISDPYVILTDDKPRVVTALGVTHFIDDKFANVAAVAKACQNTRVFTIPYGHNSKELRAAPSSVRQQVTPVGSLSEFVQCIADEETLDLDHFRQQQWALFDDATRRKKAG